MAIFLPSYLAINFSCCRSHRAYYEHVLATSISLCLIIPCVTSLRMLIFYTRTLLSLSPLSLSFSISILSTISSRNKLLEIPSFNHDGSASRKGSGRTNAIATRKYMRTGPKISQAAKLGRSGSLRSDLN